MAKISTVLVIMLILLNGAPAIMQASGYTEDVGVTLNTGVGDSVDNLVDNIRGTFDPSTGVIESFVSLAASTIDALTLMGKTVFAGPTAMINLLGGGQLVTVVVTVMFAPMYLLVTLELMARVVGRRMV